MQPVKVFLSKRWVRCLGFAALLCAVVTFLVRLSTQEAEGDTKVLIEHMQRAPVQPAWQRESASQGNIQSNPSSAPFALASSRTARMRAGFGCKSWKRAAPVLRHHRARRNLCRESRTVPYRSGIGCGSGHPIRATSARAWAGSMCCMTDHMSPGAIFPWWTCPQQLRWPQRRKGTVRPIKRPAMPNICAGYCLARMARSTPLVLRRPSSSAETS